MTLAEYVREHAIRGACQCGQCIDAPPNPKEHQPENHTADVIFFKVAQTNEPDADTFHSLVRDEYPHWLDNGEHGYIEMGAEMGDQGIALITMALGSLLNVWELLTSKNILPFLSEDEQMKLAGLGMIAIKVPIPTPTPTPIPA